MYQCCAVRGRLTVNLEFIARVDSVTPSHHAVFRSPRREPKPYLPWSINANPSKHYHQPNRPHSGVATRRLRQGGSWRGTLSPPARHIGWLQGESNCRIYIGLDISMPHTEFSFYVARTWGLSQTFVNSRHLRCVPKYLALVPTKTTCGQRRHSEKGLS